MSGVLHTAKNWTEDIAGWFGLKGQYDKLLNSRVGPDRALGLGPTPAPTAAPQAPTLDSAANAANQQDDLMRRRRGILSTMFAGNNQPAPTVASKQLLGS